MNVLYLRTDFWFGLKAGGSVGHTAGVIRGLTALGHRVAVVTNDELAGLKPGEAETIRLLRPFWPVRVPILRALGPLAYNLQVWNARKALRGTEADVIYHRHGPFTCAGALLSRRLRRPLVLEVNALVLRWAKQQRDVWTQRLGWIAGPMERFAFRRAALFVAISSAIREQLLDAGIPGDRILVNPNGVDPVTFRPDLSGDEVRRSLGLDGRKVVGFIGTFGSWHGVETLALAIPQVVKSRPNVSFLLIGDGPLRRATETSLGQTGVLDRVVFTGLVPQQRAPAYLAACDLYVSPHNRPGREGRFVGSPTKLFEYMAMGRGIVASELDQIAEVLEHGRTALLVPPGDGDALASAVLRLVDDPGEAARLGRGAREAVLQHHTWEHHAKRLTAALETCLAQDRVAIDRSLTAAG